MTSSCFLHPGEEAAADGEEAEAAPEEEGDGSDKPEGSGGDGEEGQKEEEPEEEPEPELEEPLEPYPVYTLKAKPGDPSTYILTCGGDAAGKVGATKAFKTCVKTKMGAQAAAVLGGSSRRAGCRQKCREPGKGLNRLVQAYCFFPKSLPRP